MIPSPLQVLFRKSCRLLCLNGVTSAVSLFAALTFCGATGTADDFYRYTNYDPDRPEHAPKPDEFAAPTGWARPQTWWHWINGNVSRAGIEADLRAMAENGYGFARIFHLNGKIEGPLKFNSPEWFDTFRFTVETAAKYGIGLGIHNCEGWSEAGGPWITPEQSMKELTWKLTRVTGNGTEQALALPTLAKAAASAEQAWDGTGSALSLPELDRKLDYAVDVAVLAWPAKRPAQLAMHRAQPRVRPANDYTQSNHKNYGVLFDGRREKSIAWSHDKSSREQFCGVTLEFAEPFEAAGIFTEVQWMYELPLNIVLEASDDGVTFTRVCALEFKQADCLASFPSRKARFWRLVRYQSENPTERVLRGVVKEHVLPVSELELLAPGEFSRAASPIDNFPAKAGVLATSGAITETTTEYPAALTLKREEILNLTPLRGADGVLRWRVPPGDWVVMRVGYTTTGKTNHPATPGGLGLEVDKFDPQALAHHFASYPQKMIDAAGAQAGRTFAIIETDSWEAGHQNWTANFPVLFQARNGYDVLPWLPVYAGECIESVATTENFLRDLRQTFSLLVMENFYGELGRLTRQRGLKYEAEPASGIFMRNAMNSYREADFPMNEVWQDAREPGVVSGVRQAAAREVASTAHFYGKKYVTCESLTSRKGNWAETPWTMKGTADTVLLAGHNVTVFHSFTHQPDERVPGWQMDPWGVSLNRKLPWWPLGRAWFDSIARTQYMLQQGKYAARILTLFSDEIPAIGATLAIKGEHQFDVIEGDGVRRFLHVEDGRLVSPGRMHYELLVVAPGTTLQLATLERLQQLLAAGAKISALKKPLNPPSLRGGEAAAQRWRQLADELYGDGAKQARRIGRGTLYVGYTADEAAAAVGLREEFRCTLEGAPAADVAWMHREHVDGTEWFWVINRQPDAERRGVFSFNVTGKRVSLWHPETGRVERAPLYFEKDGATHVTLSLAKLEGLFVVFEPQPAAEHAVRSSWSGDETRGGKETPVAFDHTKVAQDFTVFVTVSPTADRKLTEAAVRGIVPAANENFALYPEQMHVKMKQSDHACAGLSVGRNSVAVFEHGTGFFNSVLVWNALVPENARVALRYARGVPTLFVNGREVARGKATGRVVHPPAELRRSFKGVATDFSVEAQALSPDAIADRSEKKSAGREAPIAAKEPRLLVAADGRLAAEFSSAGALQLETSTGRKLQLAAANIPPAQQIAGPFMVSFDPQRGGPAEPQQFAALTSWTESPVAGVKHYSGLATYTKEFVLSSAQTASDVRAYLVIDEVAEVAKVTINGRVAGTLWRPPYRLDVTDFVRAGANTLSITVGNTWVNRCLYDATLPEAQRLTWANTMQVHYPDPKTIKPGDYFPWKTGPLRSGLLGAMKLQFTRVVAADK